MRPRKVPTSSDGPAKRELSYDLEQLFLDQDRDLVMACVPPLVVWTRGETACTFELRRSTGNNTEEARLHVTWDLKALARLVPGFRESLRVLRGGRGPQREHVVELAAYGLAFVAISAWMPGRRVITFRKGSAPDMLFDVTPGVERGVEVAGRSDHGYAALRVVRDEKAPTLRALVHVAEVHLSLWCADPRVSLWEQVKP